MPKTESEKLFETYLKGASLTYDYEQLPGKKKPDYVVHFVTGDAIVEVKSLPDEKHIAEGHLFTSQIKKVLKTFDLPFSIVCYCTSNFSASHLRDLKLLLRRFSTVLASNMKVGDTFFISSDYKVPRSKLICIKHAGASSEEKTFFTTETFSGKHELLYGEGGFGWGDMVTVEEVGSGLVGDVLGVKNISRFKDPIFRFERASIDGKYVLEPLNGGSFSNPKRIRDAIVKAKRQFQPYKNEHIPRILIVYNVGMMHLELEDVMEAMFGDLTMVFDVVLKPTAEKNREPARTYYGKRAMMKGKNTTFSAVGLLLVDPNSKPYILVVHNPDAKIRLPIKAFSQDGDENHGKVGNTVERIDDRSKNPTTLNN